ncbi:MAG: glucodextranase DOMON-like domain-containing protein, partial [Solirubrobacteraceae bacterium]
ADAWSERLEAQGFASPIWVDATGTSLGNPQFIVDDASGTATLILPQSTFGTPGPGWVFTVALTGQGSGQPPVRNFTQPAGEYSFGVCQSGISSPICAVSPNNVPTVIDTIPPGGVSQDTELDPTRGAVQLQGVSP